MLKTQLIHPQILGALGRAGHGSKILLSDGNYPHITKRGPNAEVVYLNLAPGLLKLTDVLQTLVTAVPIERAEIMDYARSGPYALNEDPPIWKEYSQLLQSTDCAGALTKIERFTFYDAASTPDVCLTIATGEQRMYANLLLTIGVVRPAA
jgi:L-fucose mutarotase